MVGSPDGAAPDEKETLAHSDCREVLKKSWKMMM